MNQKSLVKPLAATLGALGVSILVPVVSVAFAEMSVPEASMQSAPVTSSEIQSTSMIDIKTDVNQDGLPDQLLTEAQKLQDFHDAELARLQSVDSTDEQAIMRAIEAQNAAVEAANIQFEARLPYSDNARQIIAQTAQINEQRELYSDIEYGQGGPEQSALEGQLRQLGGDLNQDASYLEVSEALQKVYNFLSQG
jgi:hypothetical protein